MGNTVKIFASFLALFAASFFSGDAKAVSCNSPSGFVQSYGTFSIGDTALFGPDCNHILSGNAGSTPSLSGPNIWTGDNYFGSGRPWVDVRALGATGNGSTNDTAAVNSAITLLNTLAGAGGGVLYFPPGVYCLNAGVTVTGVNVIVQGAGASVLSACGSNVTPLTLNSQYNQIRDITILGFNSVSATAPALTLGSGCISCFAHTVFVNFGTGILNNATDSVLEQITAYYSYGSSVVKTAGAGFWLKRAKIDQLYPQGTAPAQGTTFAARANDTVYTAGTVVSLSGFYIQAMVGGTSAGSPPALQTYGVNFTDGGVTWQLLAPTTYYGLQMDTATPVMLVFNSDFTGPFQAGIAMLNSASGVNPSQLFVDQTTFGQNFLAGIYANAGNGLVVSSSQFTNCIFTNCMGVDLTATWNGDTTISNNLIYGNVIGIGIGGGTNTAITSNQVYGASNVAINVSGNVNDFNIVGNIAGASAAWGANFRCISVQPGTSNNYNISGNNCAGATGSTVLDGGTGASKFVGANGVQCPPVFNSFASGTNATYTTPICGGIDAKYLLIEEIGGGGGGAGSGAASGAATAGGNTCWNTSGTACTSPLYVANGGGAGTTTNLGSSTGGTAAGCDMNLSGGDGGLSANGNGILGGAGGQSFFGGAAPVNSFPSTTTANGGVNAKANTGSGASGASAGASANSGGGGAAGGYCRKFLINPATSYVYTIGAAGAAGTAGTSGAAGGAGAAGLINVTASWY